MAKILIYNNDIGKMETYYRGENESMPYNTNGTLTVGEFRGSSSSEVLWSTKICIQSWNSQRFIYGKSIPVGFAFKRPYEGGHSNQSSHYAGVAFDVGQTLSSSERTSLYNSAVASNIWTYVEPISLTPTWIHFDKRMGTAACSTGGFPYVSFGSINNYVLILQDDLNTLGYNTNGLDGIFGSATDTSVKSYQRSKGLTVDGIVGCNTWRSLQESVVGTGRTSTTID